MAKDIALGIVIGGAVSATFGKAITDTTSKIDGMKKRANDARLWQRQIGETVRLQEEFRRLHAAGDSAADGIRRKLDSNLKSLREAGIEVSKLDRAYAQLGRTARGLDLKAAGFERMEAGKEAGRGVIGDAVKLSAAVAVPATIAANYQAIIRDISIKAGIARTQQETAMGLRIRKDAADNGIGRNELAERDLDDAGREAVRYRRERGAGHRREIHAAGAQRVEPGRQGVPGHRGRWRDRPDDPGSVEGVPAAAGSGRTSRAVRHGCRAAVGVLHRAGRASPGERDVRVWLATQPCAGGVSMLDILKTVAPWLVTALTGGVPGVAAMAASAIADRLGLGDGSVEAVTSALSGQSVTPEQLLALK